MIKPPYYISCLFTLFLFLGWGSMAHGAAVKDVRIWHAPDRSRVVFDIDTKVKFKVFTLRNPARVVIDIPHSQLTGNLPKPDVMGPFIKNIRLGYHVNDMMRLVFDVKKPVRYFIQLLKPVDNYQYRLVVDYYHRNTVTKFDSKLNSNKPSHFPKIAKSELLILIDPGHGGEDSGAVGRRSYEKNIVLQISEKLKNEINKQPGMRAELTRSGDYYISLRKRTRIARDKEADLFISIHSDAFKDKNARGASVYALSQSRASSETAKWLANKENAADLVGGVSLADKDDLLAGVLLDLSMTKTVSESISFGREVLDELKKIGKVHSKRVEQASFAILKSPDIPSILVETAYITNPQEESLLRNTSHQKKIAQAIVAGINRHLKKSRGIYVN